jgi:GntR family carbon starvation induced transcriptional regulator
MTKAQKNIPVRATKKEHDPSRGAERATLADEVVGRLRADIVSGRLKPGERLRFGELTALYGVSVSPLREALSRLTAEELVQPDAQRGYRVAAVSLSDLMDILESQKALEAMALRLAIADGDDSWEAQLLAAHHRLTRREARRGTEPDETWAQEWEERHREYHQALIAGCRLLWVRRFCAQLREHLDRYRNFAEVPPSRFPKIAMQHEAIVEAALARDADRASSLLHQHYDAAAKIILEAMKQSDSVPKQQRRIARTASSSGQAEKLQGGRSCDAQ